MSRSWLEENHWLQGSFVTSEDIELLRAQFPVIPEGDIYLITASQSCDACASMDKEKFIEFSVARPKEEVKGNFLHNKNPRCLHIITEDNGFNKGFESINLELLAHEKIRLEKINIEKVKKIKPCEDITLRDTTVSQYANWLASRYNRPALPSTFERRFKGKWGSSQEKKLKKVSKDVIGVYVDIYPDEEVIDDQSYDVDLLFLITEEAKNTHKIYQEIQDITDLYKQAMSEAGFNVGDIIIGTKEEVSIATLETHKRLLYDNLSYKNQEPLPPSSLH